MALIVAASFTVFTACVKSSTGTDNPLPTTYSPSIIMGSDNFSLIALDPTTGGKNWSFGLSGAVEASPIVYREKVYAAAINGDTIYKLDSRTGSLVAKFPIHNGATWGIAATPIASGYMLYVAGMSDTLYAIDTGTGKVYWTYGADGALESSPTIFNGNIYFASMNGTVFCVNGMTGALVWKLPLGLNHAFFSSASVSYPYLFIGSLDSNLYSIYLDPPSPPTGLIRYTFKTGGPIYSSPTAFAGRVLVGSEDGNLYCIDTQTFVQDWKFMTSNYVNSSPVFSELQQVVYFADYNYNLYAVNIGDGSRKWVFPSTGLINSSPVLYGSSIFIGSYDKNLYAIDTQYGAIKWHYNINGSIQITSPVIDDLSGSQINSGISGYSN